MRLLKTKQPMNSQGYALVEVLLAASLLVITLSGIAAALFYGIEGSQIGAKRSQAAALANEGLEAVRNIRDADYATFASIPDGTYGLVQSGGQWQLSGSSDTVDGYTREITLSTISSSSRDVIASISWQQNLQRAGELTIATRLTNWSAIAITTTSWDNSGVQSSVDIAGNNNGNKVQIQGDYAYFVMAGGSPNFFVYNISNPAAPSLAGSLALSGTLNNIYVDGDYAYVASTDNSQELQIIDVSNPAAPSLAASYNDSGNDDARGVYKSGDYAYLALNGGNDLVIVDVANPLSPSFAGGTSLNGGAYEVTVTGNYAYVASGSNSQELQVVSVTNKNAPSLATSINLSGNSDALTIAHSGNSLFIGQGTTLYTYDITTPASPSAFGSLDLGGGVTVNDIAFDLAESSTQLFVVTSGSQKEFVVIDVSTAASPVEYGTYNISAGNGFYGVAYSPALDRAAIVGSNNGGEFTIMEPL